MPAATYRFKINAPLERVWEAIEEAPEYENWNPFFVRATGMPHQGATIDLICALDMGKTVRGKAEVISNQHMDRLAWNMSLNTPGFRSWTVDMRVSETGPASCDLKVITDLRGMSFLLRGPRIEQIADGFDRMATALNRHFGEQAMAMPLAA
jgi:hypothetical protein